MNKRSKLTRADLKNVNTFDYINVVINYIKYDSLHITGQSLINDDFLPEEVHLFIAEYLDPHVGLDLFRYFQNSNYNDKSDFYLISLMINGILAHSSGYTTYLVDELGNRAKEFVLVVDINMINELLANLSFDSLLTILTRSDYEIKNNLEDSSDSFYFNINESILNGFIDSFANEIYKDVCIYIHGLSGWEYRNDPQYWYDYIKNIFILRLKAFKELIFSFYKCFEEENFKNFLGESLYSCIDMLESDIADNHIYGSDLNFMETTYSGMEAAIYSIRDDIQEIINLSFSERVRHSVNDNIFSIDILN